MVVKFKLDEIKEAAGKFIAALDGALTIALHGEMGAGKTTFIQAVCEQLGVTDTVSSPTFSIINQYQTRQGNVIYHMDLYRLKDDAEAVNAGVEDALYSGSLCLIEWPEKAPGILPEETIHCYLTTLSTNERKLQINL